MLKGEHHSPASPFWQTNKNIQSRMASTEEGQRHSFWDLVRKDCRWSTEDKFQLNHIYIVNLFFPTTSFPSSFQQHPTPFGFPNEPNHLSCGSNNMCYTWNPLQLQAVLNNCASWSFAHSCFSSPQHPLLTDCRNICFDNPNSKYPKVL